MNQMTPALRSPASAERPTRIIARLLVHALTVGMCGIWCLSCIVFVAGRIGENSKLAVSAPVERFGYYLPPSSRFLFRKLHLVRPDLLRYPVEYAVYC